MSRTRTLVMALSGGLVAALASPAFAGPKQASATGAITRVDESARTLTLTIGHPVERPPIDTERFRRPRPIAADRPEDVHQVAAFELLERRQALEHPRLQLDACRRRVAGRPELDIVRGDVVPARGQHEALDRVF